jgi:hypothetical protein
VAFLLSKPKQPGKIKVKSISEGLTGDEIEITAINSLIIIYETKI